MADSEYSVWCDFIFKMVHLQSELTILLISTAIVSCSDLNDRVHNASSALIEHFPVLSYADTDKTSDKTVYKSDAYLQSTKNGDKGMEVVYSAVNQFIRSLGKPFPHRRKFCYFRKFATKEKFTLFI